MLGKPSLIRSEKIERDRRGHIVVTYRRGHRSTIILGGIPTLQYVGETRIWTLANFHN